MGGLSNLPVFINPRAAGADDARAALGRVGGFDVHDTDPGQLTDAIAKAVTQGARRIVVAGGDGTLSTAANALSGSGVELALIPGGTLNHFAKDRGIPTDAAQAAELARDGTARPIDAARVNQRLFLNTSSVGAYAMYVRTRDRYEPAWGYRVASALAAGRMLSRMPTFSITLEVEGVSRTYKTPLVFIGVGERELRLPTLGSRVGDGQSGLHVMVVRHRTGARVLALALAAAARGINAVSRTPALDAFLVKACTIQHHRPNIAVDGEIVTESEQLDYRLVSGAVRIVQP